MLLSLPPSRREVQSELAVAGRKRDDRSLPQAGTGSEVTKASIVTDTETQEKMLCMGRGLMPTIALVDFELTCERTSEAARPPPRQARAGFQRRGLRTPAVGGARVGACTRDDASARARALLGWCGRLLRCGRPLLRAW